MYGLQEPLYVSLCIARTENYDRYLTSLRTDLDREDAGVRFARIERLSDLATKELPRDAWYLVEIVDGAVYGRAICIVSECPACDIEHEATILIDIFQQCK